MKRSDFLKSTLGLLAIPFLGKSEQPKQKVVEDNQCANARTGGLSSGKYIAIIEDKESNFHIFNSEDVAVETHDSVITAVTLKGDGFKHTSSMNFLK